MTNLPARTSAVALVLHEWGVNVTNGAHQIGMARAAGVSGR